MFESAATKENLTAIAASVEALRSHLDLLQSLSNDLQNAKQWNVQLEKHWAKRRNSILSEMRELTARAAETAATSAEQLNAKACIWLDRWVPAQDDDIGCLAASICRDILNRNRDG